MGAVELIWLDRSDPDRRHLDGAVAVLEAARVADCPHGLPRTTGPYRAWLQHGWDDDPPEGAVLVNEPGRVVGVLEVTLPFRDNRHLGFVELTVDPAQRRQGLGRLLYEAALARLRPTGRSLVMTEYYDIPAAVGFAAAVGLEPALVSVQRRQHLWELDRSQLASLLAESEQSSGDYELLHLRDDLPPDLLDALAVMASAINDAPLGDLRLEDEVYTPDRLVAFREARRAGDMRIYEVVARHRGTGELAGHTIVAVPRAQPWAAEQLDTSVLEPHRGHRLGLRLKADMLTRLAVEEPQLRTLDTWNAESNSHMIQVNEQLGYRTVATGTTYQAALPQTTAQLDISPVDALTRSE